MKHKAVLFLVLFFLLSSHGYSSDSDGTAIANANLLKTQLTPIGAEREGNQDGSIPSWSVDRLSATEHEQWVASILDEQPLYHVDSDNYHEHLAQLSAGLVHFLESDKTDFFIPVYPSHRTAQQPKWIYQNSLKNLADAKISPSGDELLQAWAGIPFPIPVSPQQIMWNHQARWKGVFLKLNLLEITVFPNLVKETLRTSIESYTPFNNPNRQGPELDWRIVYYFSHIMAPSRLAGGGLLIHDSLQSKGKPRQSWVYIAGERRMRRMPSATYDSPLFNSDGIRVADEIDLFNGPLDRYDWRLMGKREMLIPYNNQKMRNKACDDESALLPYHLAPNTMRFEKHRVWVVEAKLKPAQRHLYHRRTFYIDEDTWSIVMVDIYDKDDQLMRFSLRFSAYYEDLPGVFTARDSYHDLNSGAYFVQCSAGKGTTFSQQPPPKGYFSPTNIRQRYRR